jgi:PAS domain S-box-containing protein
VSDEINTLVKAEPGQREPRTPQQQLQPNEELIRLASELTPLDLPVGVYIVRRDGRFVECNRRAREILNLPLEGDLDDSITRFYHSPRERDQIHDQLLKIEERGLYLEKLLVFEVAGREVIVRDSTRSIRDSEDNVIGYVSCMIDVTEAERSYRLLDALPVGVYRLDAQDRFETANSAFARILDYDSPEEIANKPSSDFYANPEEAAKLRRLVEQSHPEAVTNFIAEMHKKDGEKIFVSINAHMLEGENGVYAGGEGTISDVTRQERYYRILRDVPVGLNSVRQDVTGDLIEDCNEQFLKLFDFEGTDTALARGFDERQLYASREVYKRFMAELELAAKQHQPLVRHHLKVITRSSDEKTIEISSQPLTDAEGNVVGRTSAMYDITQEAELRERLNELTHDFGSVLHNYTTTLLMVQLSSKPVIQSLGPDPLENKELTPELANDTIATPAAHLAELLQVNVLNLAKEEDRATVLTEKDWRRLEELRATLRGFREQVMDVARPGVLGAAALEIIEYCSALARSLKFPRGGVVAVRCAAQELVRISNLISLHKMRAAVIEMDHQVRSLREFVTKNTRRPEEKEVLKISSLVRHVRDNLEEYARSRRIQIRIEIQEATVKVERRDVVRGLTDLLHNAIKYSWSRESKPAWVTIRTFVVGGQVYVEFQNWGVPIKKEEIEEELIFKIGYRGMHSGDRGRVGTGIGLADARRVARAHRGDVVVSSQPAVSTRAADYYNGPFITTVTMKLPLHRG